MNAQIKLILVMMLACALLALPASAALNKISQGGDVFIGEKGLDISPAIGSSKQIAWWQPGSNSETEQPADIESVSDKSNYYMAPDTFLGKTGIWYRWDGKAKGGPAFNVKDPSINVKIWDTTAGEDITGKSVPVGNYVNFAIETNMQSITTRAGYQASDGPFKLKVKTSDGATYTELVGNNGKALALKGLTVNQQLWYWIGEGNDHTKYAKNDGWDTAAEDASNNRLYKPGVYSVTASCNANKMQDQYKAPDGSDYTTKTITPVKSVQIVTDQVKIESNKDSVVRGNTFSVTITGVPSTQYILWVKGTNSMTGLSGDQPPMILTTQDNVKQDDPAGPYEIGKYQYEGGAGKTVKQDVPDDPDYHGTKCYAQVKLGTSGTRTVEFKTTKDTKDNKYTLRVERKNGNQYKSDEVDIKIEKGSVSIVAAGDQSYYLGEEVKLSGTNSETDTTYLFITGPNLPTNGAMLKSPKKAVNNAQPQSFDSTDVQDDDTWDFKWQTANLEIDAGTYTIYAVSSPSDKDNLNDAQYDTVSLVIKKPYIQATASGSVVAKGDKLYVRGTAEGDPSLGVAVWILGKNKVLYATESVNDDKSFEYEITKETTQSLYAGQYFVVIQHPMYNNEFDIYPDNPLNPQNVLGTYPTRGAQLFKIGGQGALQGTDAAEALIQAINNAMVDDTYTKLQFLVEEPKITINPIGEQKVGSKFEISGTTNLAYDDNDLLVELTSSSFKPTDKSQSGEFSGATGTVKVQQGTDGLNKWSFSVDASTFKPDEYIARVSGVTIDVVETALFNVVEAGGAPSAAKEPSAKVTPAAPVANTTKNATPVATVAEKTTAPTEKPTTVATTKPTEKPTTAASTPEPTKKSPGFGALAALAGLGAVAFLTLRRK
ncbi:MAG TPA: MEMAR_RS02690 family S-layer glycoprotein [Methanospirillum sp.]|uniref:MEMAR_RS02690 family S-layer glycoprotein n=1 Tax=Methanospirillum sp. TaxID=45200 RepID=UPI002C064B91|nr:MEMAR_RS02690 family S-layer glycoprotein [Methanospirillum sp.]HWQ63536.1 MEMAR_RS02690 family S-layer glycoprotein [Methanospirillum sp.]